MFINLCFFIINYAYDGTLCVQAHDTFINHLFKETMKKKWRIFLQWRKMWIFWTNVVHFSFLRMKDKSLK